MLNPNIDLRTFITQNHSFMTIMDIIEETGADHAAVTRMFKKLELQPINKTEQLVLVMQHHCSKLTMAQFCEKFEYSGYWVHKIASTHGILFLEKPLQNEQVPHKTIAERLRSVRMDSSTGTGDYIPFVSGRGPTTSSGEK